MKNKKILMFVGIIIFIFILLLIGYAVFKNSNNKFNNIIEYIPEEEITDEQLRQTIVMLYFMNKETGMLSVEPRKIDAKLLIDNPYKYLVELLIDGPDNSNLIRIIPINTNVINVELKDNVLYLDLSNDFIKEQKLGVEQETLIVKSIVNTLTQLNEVQGVKILIEGQENLGFPDNELLFNNIFLNETI